MQYWTFECSVCIRCHTFCKCVSSTWESPPRVRGFSEGVQRNVGRGSEGSWSLSCATAWFQKNKQRCVGIRDLLQMLSADTRWRVRGVSLPAVVQGSKSFAACLTSLIGVLGVCVKEGWRNMYCWAGRYLLWPIMTHKHIKRKRVVQFWLRLTLKLASPWFPSQNANRVYDTYRCCSAGSSPHITPLFRFC